MMATVSAFDFHDLARKAVPFLLNEDVESAFSSINKGTNGAWKSLNAAMTCFENKIKLDYDMNSLKKTINSQQKKKKKERRGSNIRLNIFSRSKSANKDEKNIQNARLALSKLTINCDTALLLRELERGFALNTGTLSILPNGGSINQSSTLSILKRSNNDHKKTHHRRQSKHKNDTRNNNTNNNNNNNTCNSNRSSKQRSHSVTRFADKNSKKSMLIDRTRSSRNVIALQDEKSSDLQILKRGASSSVSAHQSGAVAVGGGVHHGYSKSIVINPSDIGDDKAKKRSMSCVPNIGTKQYLQFLLERALTDKAWNDNDAERLCKAAVGMNCDWITVHSMWVSHCHLLIEKYHEKKLKHQERQEKMKKSRVRRSSRNVNSLYNNEDSSSQELDIINDAADDAENKNNNKVKTKICTTIGYPSGSSSTASKVAEATQAVLDGSKRIRLMISAGKVVIGDWSYIMNEIKLVVSSCSGADVRIVFPDTPQITGEIKQTFNEKIIKGMSKKGELDHEVVDAKTMEIERIQQNKKRIQKYIENEMSESDDDADDDNHCIPNKNIERKKGFLDDNSDEDDDKDEHDVLFEEDDDDDDSEADDADDSDEPTPNCHRSTQIQMQKPVLLQSFTTPLDSKDNRGPGFNIPPPPNRKPPRMPHRRQQTVQIESLSKGREFSSSKAQHRRVGSDRATRLSKFKYKAPTLNIEKPSREQRRSKSRGDIRYKHKKHESRSENSHKKHKKSSHKHSSRSDRSERSDHKSGHDRRHKRDRHHKRSQSRHHSTHKSKSKSKHSHSHRKQSKNSKSRTINL